jgi:tetratricopeptide (TPR) repeat protein
MSRRREEHLLNLFNCKLYITCHSKQTNKMSSIHQWSTSIIYSQTLVEMMMQSHKQYESSQSLRYLIHSMQYASHLLLIVPELEIDWLISPSIILTGNFTTIIDSIRKDAELIVENAKRDGTQQFELDNNVMMVVKQVELYYELLQVLYIRCILMNLNKQSDTAQNIHSTFAPVYKKKQQYHLESALIALSGIQNDEYVPLVNNANLSSSSSSSSSSSLLIAEYSSMDQSLLVTVSVNNVQFEIPKLDTIMDNISYWSAIVTAQQWIYKRRDNNGRSENLVREFGSIRKAVQLARQCGYIHWILAMNYQEQKQYSAAIREYKEAIQYLPKGHIYLSTAYYRAAHYEMLDWNNDPSYLNVLTKESSTSKDEQQDELIAQEISKRMKPIRELYSKGEQAEEDNRYQVKKLQNTISHANHFLCTTDSTKALVKSKLDLRQNQSLAQVTPIICRACQRTMQSVKRCASCKSVYYCSPYCQKSDWPRHKMECKK